MQPTSFLKLAVLSLGLVSTSSAYVIDLFSGPNCTGDVRENNNVYDNTCSTPTPGFASVRVKAYGAGRQKAFFDRENNCAGSYPIDGYTNGSDEGQPKWWADGGGPSFQIGDCINLAEIANAAGSFSE